MVIDKENAQARQGLLMIDASKDFINDGNKIDFVNRISEKLWTISTDLQKFLNIQE